MKTFMTSMRPGSFFFFLLIVSFNKHHCSYDGYYFWHRQMFLFGWIKTWGRNNDSYQNIHETGKLVFVYTQLWPTQATFCWLFFIHNLIPPSYWNNILHICIVLHNTKTAQKLKTYFFPEHLSLPEREKDSTFILQP